MWWWNRQRQQPTTTQAGAGDDGEEQRLTSSNNGDDVKDYGGLVHHDEHSTARQHRGEHNNEDDEDGIGGDGRTRNQKTIMSLWTIGCILSTAFSYGCILTTLFLITLPVECQRINISHPAVPKSVSLGIFVSIAGVTQLISPLIGHLSDEYRPPRRWGIGRRLPYLVVGSFLTVLGLIGQMLASRFALWLRYGLAFVSHMLGLNIMYAMMIALIPDQISSRQTGVANGILALLLVTGSLFGFALFHSILAEDIQNMYSLYTTVVIVTSILTGTHAHDKDAQLASLCRRVGDDGSIETDNGGSCPRQQQQQQQQQLQRHPATRTPKWKRRVKTAARQATKAVLLTPTMILKTMFVDPIREMEWETLRKSYTIDIDQHYDFFVVTVSRLFYYCGMSVQTFFLYFLHDIIRIEHDTERAVASLAILGQVSGALTCYPVGYMSDRWFHSRRKPFVYLACFILAGSLVAVIFATTLHQMVILSFLLGGANGIYLTMDTSLAVDTLPQDEEVNSGDDEVGIDPSASGEGHGDGNADVSTRSGNAQLLGVWGVAAFVGATLGPMIGGPLLYAFGRQAKTDDIVTDEQGTAGTDTVEEYQLAGYAVLLSLAAFYLLCSAASLRFIKNPHV